MTPEDLKQRTKEFALRIIRLVGSLPKGTITNIIGKQLLRSGTAVGANYRSACRSRSTPDFISRICIAEEEADESQYWMELLVESKILPETRLSDLMREANEITAILGASVKTAKQTRDRASSN